MKEERNQKTIRRQVDASLERFKRRHAAMEAESDDEQLLGAGKPVPILSDILTHFLLDLARILLDKVAAERETQQEKSGVLPTLLDRKGAAAYLGISPSTLDELRKSGQVKVVYVNGGEWPKYPRKELDRYVERLRKEGR